MITSKELSITDIPSEKIAVHYQIALASLNWYREKDPRTALGIAFIGSYLLEKITFEGINNLHLLEYDVRENLSQLIHQILIINPKVLGLGVYCWNEKQTKQLLKDIRSIGFKGIIVLGGPEISYGNEQLKEEYPEVEYFVKGDGEEAFYKIIEGITLDKQINIPGVYSQESISFDGVAQVSNLDSVPSPYQNEKVREKLIGKTFIRWQTQRGCFFKCSFCAFTNPQANSRTVSAEKTKQDLLYFKEQEIKEVAVLDPIFFANKKRALEILDLIEKITPQTRFEIQTRLEHLNQEIIEKVAKLNIVLECGIQTLNKEIQKVISRKNNKEKVLENLKLIQERQVPLEAHLIYGLPLQTLESLLDDIETIMSFKPSKLRIFPLILLKGTPMYEQSQTEYKAEMKFAPSYPQYVIETKWMDKKTIFALSHIQEFLDQEVEKEQPMTAQEMFTQARKTVEEN
jgi:radical SAM superfamily enzyme YgiQ (UPF0313 family)